MQPEQTVWQRSACGHAATRFDDRGRCRGCAIRELPCATTTARQTPEWTAATVPAALLASHHTARWAELVVVEGNVVFREDEGFAKLVAAGDRAVIVPHRPHRIIPSPSARFHVQFYELPGDDSAGA